LRAELTFPDFAALNPGYRLLPHSVITHKNGAKIELWII